MDGNAATGMATGETQRFPAGTRFGQLLAGGTSLATPLTAGMEALAVQAAHGRLGWINPAIYAEARRRARTFTDVRPTYDDRAVVLPVYNDPFDPTKGEIYMLRTLGDSGGFGTPLMAAPGWDPPPESARRTRATSSARAADAIGKRSNGSRCGSSGLLLGARQRKSATFQCAVPRYC